MLTAPTFTGGPELSNHLYNGESVGAIFHFNDHNSIWLQETFNKVVSVPWYTTTSVGYTRAGGRLQTKHAF